MTVVLDTNVWISGLLFPGGPPDKIIRLLLTGRFFHATSPDLLTELRKVLERKFRLPRERIESLIRLVTQAGEIVYPTERLAVVQKDEADNRILECALTARADRIITGDEKHLLSLRSFRKIKILTPSGFLKQIGIPLWGPW